MTDWPTQPDVDPFDFTEGASVRPAPRSVMMKLDAMLLDGGMHYTTADRIYSEVVAPLLAEAERRGAERAVEIVRCLPGHTHIPPPEDEPWEHYGSIAIWDAGDYADALAEALRAGDDQ